MQYRCNSACLTRAIGHLSSAFIAVHRHCWLPMYYERNESGQISPMQMIPFFLGKGVRAGRAGGPERWCEIFPPFTSLSMAKICPAGEMGWLCGVLPSLLVCAYDSCGIGGFPHRSQGFDPARVLLSEFEPCENVMGRV